MCTMQLVNQIQTVVAEALPILQAISRSSILRSKYLRVQPPFVAHMHCVTTAFNLSINP
jgi:hypothetical protein